MIHRGKQKQMMVNFSRSPKKKQALDEAALYEYAIGVLGRRMRTVAELKTDR